MAPTIAIVVPCYNEEKVLPETCRRLIELTDELINEGEIATDTTVYFVDDGSRDQTWALISQFAMEHRRIAGIKLSRNQGHQNALMAGLSLPQVTRSLALTPTCKMTSLP